MEPLATSVDCDPACFTRVERFNCDSTPMADTLKGCAALWLEFPTGGGAHVAYHVPAPGVVELVAVQGETGRGSVLDYLPWLEDRVNGHAVRLVTQRRGLMRELAKQGYTARGVIWQKDLYGRQKQ